MEYCRVRFQGAPVVVRDLEEADLDTLVRYWHESEPAYLESIGVDVSKLGHPDETRARFRASIRSGAKSHRRVALVFAAPDGPLGYTNLHLVDPDHVYAHVHLVRPDVRGAGLLSKLFPHVVAAFFEHFEVQRLVFETSPGNRAINALIGRFGFTPEKRRVEQPDGMARPGELLVYTVTRADLASFGAIAPGRAAAR